MQLLAFREQVFLNVTGVYRRMIFMRMFGRLCFRLLGIQYVLDTIPISRCSF